MMRDSVAMVMAGGRGERLGPLTQHRAKPAVPFGGLYRLIDFTLSNCINSDMRRIFVLTQYRSVSLIQHLRDAWSFLPAVLGEFILPISPHQWTRETWYLGTADAIYQNLRYIAEHDPRFVFILAGDHVYKMDYRRLLAYHKIKGADVTVAAVEVPVEEGHQFGIIEVDENFQIMGFQEKPSRPRQIPGRPGVCFASMGIYLFDRGVLEDALVSDAADQESRHDFGKNVIPSLIEGKRVFAYDFKDEEKSTPRYWRDVGTIDSYFEANMDLVRVSPELNLYSPTWPIRTEPLMMPPPKFVFAQAGEGGRRGVALDSLVSPGCIISGGRVHRSVLSPDVRVNSFARVEHSILLNGVQVGRRAVVRNAVIDKEVFVPEGAVIVGGQGADRERFFTSPNGIVVVQKRADLSNGA